ncbi:MAG TPA: hypothetical protein PK640_22105, partial [Verrucomicrobiota bacterium]|nr:hypothetical protein [Verrucomicrobiota bacterium]
ATASLEGTTQVWDLQEGSLLREVGSDEGREVPVTFLDGSNHLVTQQRRGGGYRAWDVTSGRETRRWRLASPNPMSKSVLSPDGQWCLALDGDGGGRLLQVASGQETPFPFNLRQVSGAAFSPDGRWFAAVSVLGVGQLWDTASARMRANVEGFLQGTHSVAFSPDGQRLAIGSNGNEAIKLWDVGSLQELLTLPGQGSMFNATAFSRDGSVLASANSGGLLHIWRAPSFEEIARREADDH